MGKTFFITLMKAVFFIIALLSIKCIKTQSAMTSMEKCVSEVRTSVDDLMLASTEGLKGDMMGAVAKMITSFTDIQSSMTDCKAVQMNDVLMWLDQHTNDAQKACLQKTIAGLMNIKVAENTWNDKTKTTAEKLAAWGNVMDLMEKAWLECTPEK